MTQGNTQKVEGRMLRLPAVLEKVGGSKTWWYELMAAGEAPQPIRYSIRHVVWPEASINAWIAARVASAGQPAKAGA